MKNFFSDKVAVVTGAGSGIGLAVAQQLAKEGAHVMAVDVEFAQGSEIAGCTQVPADVTKQADVEALERQTLIKFGRVDVLVNSAGVSLGGSVDSVSLENLAWVMDVNFMGTARLCKVFLKHLLRSKNGRILNISSSFGWVGFANKSGYSASKFAVRGFSDALRAEYLGTSLRVTTLFPGPVATQLVSRGRCQSSEQKAKENRFLRSVGLDPAWVAKRALAATRKGEYRVILSWQYRLIDCLCRFSPSLAHLLLAKASKHLPF